MNIKELKKEIERRKTQSMDFFRPKNGDIVRVVATLNDEGNGLDYKIRVVEKHILDGLLDIPCKGEDCIICKKREEIRVSIQNWTDEIKAVIKSLYPKEERYILLYVVNSQNQESNGKTYWFRANKEIFNSIVNLIITSENDGVDLRGIDLTINTQQQKINNKLFEVPKSVSPSMKEKKLAAFDKVISEYTDEKYPLSFQTVEDSDIKSILDRWITNQMYAKTQTYQEDTTGSIVNRLNTLLKE